MSWTLTMLDKQKKICRGHLLYFSYFSLIICFDISCKFFPKETRCMGCQSLFSGKNKKYITTSWLGHLLTANRVLKTKTVFFSFLTHCDLPVSSVKLLCFRHLSESHFLLRALHRSNFANFCPFVVTTYEHFFYSSHWFLENQIFFNFSHTKNEAKSCRVGNLEPYFQQVPLVQFFWNVVEHQ